MSPKNQNPKERKTKEGSKTRKAFLIMPLIVVLILICVIPTIMFVQNGLGNLEETAELNKDIEQEEQISAEITDLQVGQGYTIPKTGKYKIEVFGIGTPEYSLGELGEKTIPASKGSYVTSIVNLKER